MEKKPFRNLVNKWKSYFQKSLSIGFVIRVSVVIALLLAPIVTPYLQSLSLSFLDIFSVTTGSIALILTGYQMYLATVREDNKGLKDEINETREFLCQQIEESNNQCRERYENQQQVTSYLLERINNLTIDIKSHERLPGHNGNTTQLFALREEFAEIRATMSIVSQKAEIIDRIKYLEELISLGIDKSTKLKEPNT